jgi:hypothetical protein
MRPENARYKAAAQKTTVTKLPPGNPEPTGIQISRCICYLLK